jgi:hypothetical protein
VAVFALALAFGVAFAAAAAPVVSVENAANVEYTTADVGGTVNPEGQSTTWRFQYATQADFSDAQEGPSGSTETSEAVSGPLSGLQPGTTYHLRLVAENADGQSEAMAASTFTTKAVTKPTSSEPQVSAVAGHAAHFEATVNPNAPEDNALLSQAAKDAYATHWWFTCEPGCGFSGSSEGDVAADDAPATVEASATGLLANKQYTVVLHAQNAGGEETAQATFTTALSKPEVTKSNLDGIEPGSTMFTALGNVDPNGSKVTDCHFVYGIGSASGNEVPCRPASPAPNESQDIVLEGNAGQFRLIFEGDTTTDISAEAGGAEVQAALEALPSIGPGDVSVSEGVQRSFYRNLPTFRVSFVEDLAGVDVPSLAWEHGSEPLNGFFGEEEGNPKYFISPFYDGSGQFRFKFGSELTSALPMGASGPEVQDALEGLASINPGDVNVTGEEAVYPIGSYFIYQVSFGGSLNPGQLAALTAEAAPYLPGQIVISSSSAGSFNGSVPVSADLSGLSPDTEYGYKIVATNAAGTTEGPEITFRTLKAPQQETCPNAAIRAEQHTTSANCRAYEMVSPHDKNGANVTGEAINVAVADDGNGAVFQSRGGFAGTVGSGINGFTQYLSRRGSGGWTTKGATPTPAPSSAQGIIGGTVGTRLFYFSNDLSKAVVWGFDFPGVTNDIADNDNLYRLDTDTGALETVTLSTQMDGPIGLNDFGGQGPVWGASEDNGVVSFASRTHLLPQATERIRNAYEWDHGTLRLAGILPNGDVPDGGSSPPIYDPRIGYRATVSSDGSRVLFASPLAGNQQLYMRRNHTDTVWISEPEFGSPGEPEGVYLEWVSPDAHHVLFRTTTPLVSDDTNSNADLYLYSDSPDPAAEPGNLKLISNIAPLENPDSTGSPVLGASNDAQVIYFVGLVNGAPRTVVYDHGEFRTVAANLAFTSQGLTSPMIPPGTTRVSSDGRFLAYRSVDGQLYLYDAREETLACASCHRGGTASFEVPPEPAANVGGIRSSVRGLRPRFLTDDGRVFFSTPTPLASADTNGVVDTYVYDGDTGEREMISTGRGENGQWFVNVSASGNDVFIVTNQSLVGHDGDKLTDLYDARVGGGFPEPPPPPTSCIGDNCRNGLSGQPGGVSPATAAFSGPGNRHRKPRHHKKHHKKHHRKHHRHNSKKHHTKHHTKHHSGARG